MTQRGLLMTGASLVALATIPHLLVVPLVGPINLFFSVAVSALYVFVGWTLKGRAGWLGLVLAILFAVAQFFTPIPYWMCADAGYSFCPSIAGTALKAAVFNVGDALIVLLFAVGYASILLGMRTSVSSVK